MFLFEPKAGRTRLKSLVDYDDPYCPFLYIKKFAVEARFREDEDSYSDVGAFAIRKLLSHPLMNEVSSDMYVVDGCEMMEKAEQEEYKNYSRQFNYGREVTAEEVAEEKRWKNRLYLLGRKDANQFLHNGFFQDKAYANNGGAEAKILVASAHHWNFPLKGHAAALQLPFSCEPPTEVHGPEGIDAELFKLVKRECSDDDYSADKKMASKSRENERKQMRVQSLISRGASVIQSHALHVAVANNCCEMKKYLLQLEHGAINTYDEFGNTPLMVAAVSAAGRSNKDGIENTKVIELLLAERANRDLCDPSGMTAYGHFIAQKKEYDIMMQTIMGNPAPSSYAPKNPSEERLVRMLLPSGGPTEADLHGGAKNDGIVEYSDDVDSDGDYDY